MTEMRQRLFRIVIEETIHSDEPADSGGPADSAS